MKTNDAIKLLEDGDLLDKIYQFSYHRCSTSFEAEDLSSDIILAVISAIRKQDHIDNFYAFVWTVAHRTYADHCRKKNAERQVFSIENGDLIFSGKFHFQKGGVGYPMMKYPRYRLEEKDRPTLEYL